MVIWASVLSVSSSTSSNSYLIIETLGHIHIYKCSLMSACFVHCQESGCYRRGKIPLERKQAWLYHFRESFFGRRWRGWLDHFVFNHGSSVSQYPSRFILQVLCFLPHDMVLIVHKVGAMGWDPWILGIWTSRTWYWTSRVSPRIQVAGGKLQRNLLPPSFLHDSG